MEQWQYSPAQDMGLSEAERLRSLKRESGLVGRASRTVWSCLLRSYFATCQRVTIHGREHLPAQPPFVLISNHCSHLDTLLLACALPLRLRHRVFPIAAGDTFFETPVASAFAAGMMNALPMWRKNAGRHAMEMLRARLIDEPCGYILFPEGTRSRTGVMSRFHAGIGMLVAGTNVPIIPCHLAGTFAALPANRKVPRRARITLHIGPAVSFQNTPHNREGWNHIAASLEAKVRDVCLARAD